MRRPRISIKALFFGIFLCYILSSNLWARPSLVVDAANSKGAWRKGIITDRKAVFTDKSYATSEIQMDVPSLGRYQLFAYVHHNWRKFFPCIYVEAVDSEGKEYKDYHKIENIWYLEQEDRGRWFFISLAQHPYCNLPAGKLNVKFWVEGRSSAWDEEVAPMEGRVSIDSFFLMPAVDSQSGMFLPGVINFESGKSNWNSLHYHPRYATILIETSRKNSTFSCKMNIPMSSYYQGWLSVLSPLDNYLEVKIENKSVKHKINIELNGKKEWLLIPVESLYLNKGTYSLVFKNLSSNEIMVDFFMLLPVLENAN